jgi:hypothetical protein
MFSLHVTGMNRAISLAALLVLGTSSFAAQLLEEGSFEGLGVTKRKSIAEGGNIAKASNEWVMFKDKSDPDGGRIILGLTNEIARTGRQSLFVNFDNVTKPRAVATLSSELISILPGKTYHVSIWGRVDKENPLALDQRLPLLKLRVEWYAAPPEEVEEAEEAKPADGKTPEAKPAAAKAADASPTDGKAPEAAEEEDINPTGQPEQVGEAEFRVQPMPGSKKRKPFFTAAKWSEFYADLESPAGATTMKITWTWETPPQAGTTNGLIFFDDAGVEGESGPKEDIFANDPDAITDAENKPAAKPGEAAKPVAPKSLDVTPLSTPPPKAK